MIKYLVFVTIAISSMRSYAQLSISGTVSDAINSRVLAGASIQVQGSRQSAISNEQGQYLLRDMMPGSYVLTITFLGYAKKIQKLELDHSQELNFALEESFEMTDEVVVYATRANDKTPTTFVNISKTEIQKQNFGQDLPILLNWTPAVVTTSDAGTGVGYTGIRIRGSDATRINVTINGIPYNDAESLGTFWVDVPDIASSSQSIQIQRGVGTSTNGAGAFGASINLQTNARNDLPYAILVNSGGSFNTHRHTLSLGTGLIDNKWALDGRISKINSDGFIDRASADLQSYYFSSAYYLNNTIIKAIIFGGKERTYQSWYGVPESRLTNNLEAMQTTASNEGWNEAQLNNLISANSRTFNLYTYKNQVDDFKQDHYQLHISNRLHPAIMTNVSLHYTKGRGYYEEYRNDDQFINYGLEPISIGDSAITTSDIIRRRWLDNDFYGVTYAVNYENEKWRAVLGGALNRYIGDHFGEITWAKIAVVPIDYRYYFNRGNKQDFNIYAKVNYQTTEKLNVFFDMQYRTVGYNAKGIENLQNGFNLQANFHFFNPKAGITYSLTSKGNQQVYASYSIGNREPVRDDFVDASFQAKPQNPLPETLRDLEIGYRKISERYTFGANFYLMNYKNQLVLTGAINDVGSPLRTNVKESYRNGLEIEGSIKLMERLNWKGNLTLSKNKIKNFSETLTDSGIDWDTLIIVNTNYSNTNISFSPSIIAGSGLSFTPFKNADITLLTKYVAKQFLDNTTNEKRVIDAYMVNDVRLGYIWKPAFIKEIDFSLLVNNVLDERYSSNGYTWGYLGGGQVYRENYYFPQAGRNFMVMISMKF